MARMIDGEVLTERLRGWLESPHGENVYNSGYDDAIWHVLDVIEHMPTLTQPNEGAKDKNVPTNGPLTLEELKAEAKRQGYKLIKDKHPRFERCLCGHNVHQWMSGPEGWAVYCKHCGLVGPWAKKSHSAVIEAWNAMILKNLKKRKEQTNG